MIYNYINLVVTDEYGETKFVELVESDDYSIRPRFKKFNRESLLSYFNEHKDDSNYLFDFTIDDGFLETDNEVNYYTEVSNINSVVEEDIVDSNLTIFDLLADLSLHDDVYYLSKDYSKDKKLEMGKDLLFFNPTIDINNSTIKIRDSIYRYNNSKVEVNSFYTLIPNKIINEFHKYGLEEVDTVKIFGDKYHVLFLDSKKQKSYDSHTLLMYGNYFKKDVLIEPILNKYIHSHLVFSYILETVKRIIQAQGNKMFSTDILREVEVPTINSSCGNDFNEVSFCLDIGHSKEEIIDFLGPVIIESLRGNKVSSDNYFLDICINNIFNILDPSRNMFIDNIKVNNFRNLVRLMEFCYRKLVKINLYLLMTKISIISFLRDTKSKELCGSEIPNRAKLKIERR